MFHLPRLFALIVLLCLTLPALGDARPIDWPPTPIPPATPDPAPPPCSP